MARSNLTFVLVLILSGLAVLSSPSASAQDAATRSYTYGFWDTNSCYAQFQPQAPIGGAQFSQTACHPENYTKWVPESDIDNTQGCYYHWLGSAWVPQQCRIWTPVYASYSFVAPYSNGATLVKLHFPPSMGGQVGWILFDSVTGMFYLPSEGWVSATRFVSVLVAEGFLVVPNQSSQTGQSNSGPVSSTNQANPLVEIMNDYYKDVNTPWLQPNCSASYNGC